MKEFLFRYTTDNRIINNGEMNHSFYSVMVQLCAIRLLTKFSYRYMPPMIYYETVLE